MEFCLDGKNPWTAIVVTCQNKAARKAVQNELLARQKKGLIDRSTLVLGIEDPAQGVGSGGATLNALYVTAEHLGLRQGHTTVNSDVLQKARIIILHMGPNFPFDSCGRAFTSLPVGVKGNKDSNFIFTNFDMLLYTISHQLAVDSPPGIWVCSTDMIVSFPHQLDGQLLQDKDFGIIAIPAKPEYAAHHGSLRFADDGTIMDIIYQGKPDVLIKCKLPSGKIPISSGIMYLSTSLADTLLSLTAVPPLDACSYIGLDNGAQPIKLSLLFDIALSMCTDVMEEAYVMGERSGFYGTSGKIPDDQIDIMRETRHQLWKTLNERFTTKAILVEGGLQNYLDPRGVGDSAVAFHESLLMFYSPIWHSEHVAREPERNGLENNDSDSSIWEWKSELHSQIISGEVAYQTTVINSVIENKVVVLANTALSHCRIPSDIQLGSRCYYSGLCELDFNDAEGKVLPDEMVSIVLRMKTSQEAEPETGVSRILTVVGRTDDVFAPFWEASSSIWGDSWKNFFKRIDVIDKDDLWASDLDAEDTNLFNAKLFPVPSKSDGTTTAERDLLLNLMRESNIDPDMVEVWKNSQRLSLAEILSSVDMEAEFSWRRQLFYSTGLLKIKDVLLNEKHQGLSQLYRSAVVDGYQTDIFRTLDEIARDCNSPGTVARTLANIADVLGHMANGCGGMRSGPSHNLQWKEAFDFLENGEIAKGVADLSVERSKWLQSPEDLIRAARHYDGASQILVKQAVMTGKQFVKIQDGEAVPIGTWVIAECPGRVDLSGAWSDTPPITYEHGGAVATMAVLIDETKPIGAKVRRIPETHIILRLGQGSNATTLTLNSYDDLADYNQPQARGALLKTALYCSGIIEHDPDIDLKTQLSGKYSGGLEIQSWSNLPHGSGLGTSSILAGAVLAALWTAVGKVYQIRDLTQSVLILEQMLTTGGGWQDQVGGLAGSLHLGSSKAGLPLLIEQKLLDVSSETVEALEKQFVLVYTGKTRLARDLLQNVVRRWYARLPGIVRTVDGLESNARDSAAAVERGDLEKVGKCLDICQKQKLNMAPGSEPAVVVTLRKILEPHILGMCMSGAGGGGYLYVLMKPEFTKEEMGEMISKIDEAKHVTLHSIKISTDGLEVRIDTDNHY